MTLVLQEAGGGAVTGQLSSNGLSYQIEGRIEDGTLVGAMRSSEGSLFFEADRWEGEIWMTLFGTDAQGQPNYDDYTEIDFTAAGAAAVNSSGAGTGSTGGAGSNPLASRPAGANPLAGGAPDPFVVTFTDGNVTLQLEGSGGQYQGRVAVSGEVYAVRAQSGAGGLQGIIETAEGSYQLTAQAQGSGLVVQSGGVQYDLARQTGAVGQPAGQSGPRVGAPTPGGSGGAETGGANAGRALAPGFTEDHPEVREWVSFLAGKKLTRMSSYSSGSAGGYSARTDLYLSSDRSYAMRDESSVSVDVGGALGNSGGVDNSQGRWFVITNGQVVGLVLEGNGGQILEFRMEYIDQATYANGERAYVTPAEVCR
ncbi:MAG: hypothetical protein O2958_13005 [Gemmatimonadetes bacterium]|nr:hypothetical protein [Gemmatimonadota bacterium]